jgi:hypothetical protein
LSPSSHQIIKEYSGGIGLILGFSRSFQSTITASVEIVPGFSYNKKLEDNIETIDYGFGLSSNTAAITIGYRF